MWHDFNHAWLSLFQKQKDMIELATAPQRGQSLLSEDTIKKMGEELISLCDGIERHGLVDYEYGVWEERIIESMSFPGDDGLASHPDRHDRGPNPPLTSPPGLPFQSRLGFSFG